MFQMRSAKESSGNSLRGARAQMPKALNLFKVSDSWHGICNVGGGMSKNTRFWLHSTRKLPSRFGSLFSLTTFAKKAILASLSTAMYFAEQIGVSLRENALTEAISKCKSFSVFLKESSVEFFEQSALDPSERIDFF